MQTIFPVYADPGHAWAKVPLSVIHAIDLTEGHFTGYSYRRGDNLYLEEDGDLSLFAKAFEKKNGFAPKWDERHTDRQSKIRGYDSVRSDPALQTGWAA